MTHLTKKFLCLILPLCLALLCCCGQKTDGIPSAAEVVASQDGTIESSFADSPSTSSGTSSLPVSSAGVSSASAFSSSSSTILANAMDSLSNQKIVWGPGKTKDRIRPSEPVKLQQKYEQSGASFIGPDEKKIYLTFDEGYEAGYTPQILNTLREKQVSAVFFVTYPYAKENPSLIRRMIDEGHIVGNHTRKHPVMTEVSSQRAKEEISFLHDYIQSEFGYEMTLFRPPEGVFSERTLAITKSLGYQSVFWSFAYSDWDKNKQPEEEAAFQKITSGVHNGCIYLLHAVSLTNTNILGRVIDQWRADGYEISKFNLNSPS